MIGNRIRASLLAVLGAVALLAAGCGGDDDNDNGAAGSTDVSGRLSVIGIWSGDEQRSFEAVLDGFRGRYPNVTVRYTSAGDNVPTVLSTAVEGGNPPDVAAIGQPGVVAQLQGRGALKPLEFARDEIEDNYPEDFIKLGEIDGRLYSFLFKAANKSTVWYNVEAFNNAGVEPPETWDELLQAARTLKASGIRAYSIAGADGWTLTDLFENIYLRQAGPEKYDQLSRHEIPWTDESVKQALRTMAQVLGDSSNIAGGTSGALQTDFPTSVSNVLSTDPRAAMVIEGDFVPGVVTDRDVEPGTGFDVFPFPSIGDSENVVVGGGDSIVLFKDTPAGRALIEYLASPEAATIWARRGGFSSPNKEVDEDAYPDDLTRRTATAIAEAETFRFDMSDLAPASFGGTAGQGEWKILQDFLEDPSDVDGTARRLEASAQRAFGNR